MKVLRKKEKTIIRLIYGLVLINEIFGAQDNKDPGLVSSGVLYEKSDTTLQGKRKISEDVNIQNTINILQSLAQCEIDTAALINQAIENVQGKTIQDTLMDIKNDCEKSITILASLIHRYGAEAPTYTKDFKGYFMQGYLAMRGWPSDQALMRALHTNLKLLIGTYEDALAKDLPNNIREQISQIYDKAKDRLKYIEKQT